MRLALSSNKQSNFESIRELVYRLINFDEILSVFPISQKKILLDFPMASVSDNSNNS